MIKNRKEEILDRDLIYGFDRMHAVSAQELKIPISGSRGGAVIACDPKDILNFLDLMHLNVLITLLVSKHFI